MAKAKKAAAKKPAARKAAAKKPDLLAELTNDMTRLTRGLLEWIADLPPGVDQPNRDRLQAELTRINTRWADPV